MQTAGMLRGTRATYLIALLITLIGCTHSYPLQILPSIPGHVPVYIRHGDEPLEHIHPGLAEAFHEPPSSKSFRLEDFPSPEQISFDEASRYLARFNNKIIFPAYPRDPEASTVDSLKDAKDERKGSDDSKVPPSDDEEIGEEHHGLSKRNSPSLLKEATIKLSPISDVERENLEKLAVQVAKKEIGSNNRDSNSHQVDESSKGTNRKDVLKESTNPVDIQQSENNDDLKEAGTNGDEPVKQEYPGTILANVQKLSPISPDEKKDSTDQSSTMEQDVSLKQEGPTNIHILPGTINSAEIPESSETNDSPADEESTKKATHPEHPLTNVNKLLAVPPTEQKTNSEKVTSGSTSEKMKQENSDDLSKYVHILPAMSVTTDDSELSKEETPEANGESATKVEQSENMANVLKLSPGSEAKNEMVSSGGSLLTSAAGEDKEAKEVGNHDTNSKHESNASSGQKTLPLKLSRRIGIVTNVRKLAPKETNENEKNDEVAMD